MKRRGQVSKVSSRLPASSAGFVRLGTVELGNNGGNIPEQHIVAEGELHE